jgi:hypothetical protein
MLDVHGVTGSSPVPRTIVKSPGISRIPGLFVILPNDAPGISWKIPEKVAKIPFSRVCMPDKKTGGKLRRTSGGRSAAIERPKVGGIFAKGLFPGNELW